MADAATITELKLILVAQSWSDDPAYLDAYPGYADAVRSRLDELLVDPNHRYWVAEEDGQIAGCVSASISRHLPGPDWSGISASMSDLVVRPQFRGRGIAKALMNEGMTWCERQGAFGVDLHATRMARGMYAAMGWQRREPESDDAPFVSMFWRFGRDEA